jgi:hypothetical protein
MSESPHNAIETVPAGLEAPESLSFEGQIRILGFREGSQWVAIALEMDLWGYGQSFEAALQDLRDLVLMQVTFALSIDNPEMVWRDAEPAYFLVYERVRREELRSRLAQASQPPTDYQTGGLAVPHPDVIKGPGSQFTQSHA